MWQNVHFYPQTTHNSKDKWLFRLFYNSSQKYRLYWVTKFICMCTLHMKINDVLFKYICEMIGNTCCNVQMVTEPLYLYMWIYKTINDCNYIGLLDLYQNTNAMVNYLIYISHISTFRKTLSSNLLLLRTIVWNHLTSKYLMPIWMMGRGWTFTRSPKRGAYNNIDSHPLMQLDLSISYHFYHNVLFEFAKLVQQTN